MRYITLAFALLLAACGTAPQAPSPVREYLDGVEDAVRQAAPQMVPTIVVDFGAIDRGYGECRLVSGKPFIYVYVAAIVRGGRTPAERKQLLTDVLVHELGHAALTCTDADHKVLP